MNERTRKLTIISMLCALAFIATVVGRIPVILFLKYDPKDVIVAVGGFLFGPLASFLISVLVSAVEMFTISETGIIGFVMNVISTCSFACTAAFIYKRKRNMTGAVLGLISGLLLMTGVMLLWNYFITPLYMGYPREAVGKLLLPAFLPFNLLKGGMNASISMLIYKPAVTALRKAHLIPSTECAMNTGRFNTGMMLLSGMVFVTCIMCGLVIKGVI